MASMNERHGELNGGGENLALKDEVHAQPPHRDEEPPRIGVQALSALCYSG